MPINLSRAFTPSTVPCSRETTSFRFTTCKSNGLPTGVISVSQLRRRYSAIRSIHGGVPPSKRRKLLNEHGTKTGRAAAAGFSGPRPPASINLSAYCLGSAPHRDPAKAALIVIEDAAAPVPAEIWTYRDIETAVQRVAGGFAALGFRPAARIVLQLGNTSAFPIV